MRRKSANTKEFTGEIEMKQYGLYICILQLTYTSGKYFEFSYLEWKSRKRKVRLTEATNLKQLFIKSLSIKIIFEEYLVKDSPLFNRFSALLLRLAFRSACLLTRYLYNLQCIWIIVQEQLTKSDQNNSYWNVYIYIIIRTYTSADSYCSYAHTNTNGFSRSNN